jgi:small subunit ribosomal protein S35
MFEDVPLDTRHHKFKVKPRFPVEWRMTEERRQELEDTREKSRLLDEQKAGQGLLMDGAERIETYFSGAPKEPEKIPVRIPQRAAQRLSKYPSLSPSAPAQRSKRL